MLRKSFGKSDDSADKFSLAEYQFPLIDLPE